MGEPLKTVYIYHSKRLKYAKIRQNIEIFLVYVFCFIGMLAVLNWSIGVFIEAGEFVLEGKKTTFHFNRVEEAGVSDDKDELVSAGSLPFVSVGSGSAPSASAPSSITGKIKEVFGADADVAIAVAMAESKLNPEVVGDTHLMFEKDGRTYGASYGLFQIRDLPGRIDDPEKLKNPDFNIRFAKQLYDRSGWKSWSTYLNNQYLAFL